MAVSHAHEEESLKLLGTLLRLRSQKKTAVTIRTIPRELADPVDKLVGVGGPGASYGGDVLIATPLSATFSGYRRCGD